MVTIAVAVWSVVAFFLTHGTPYESWSRYGYEPAAAVWDGAWHVLLAAAALHDGYLHILFNLIWWFLLGLAMEGVLGSRRFLCFLVTAAIASSGCHLALTGNVGVGLSGVLCAMFGYMWFARSRVPWYRFLDRFVIGLFLAFLVVCVLLKEFDYWRVANIGHLSGLLFGIFVAEGFVQKQRRPMGRIVSLAILVFAIVATLLGWSLPWSAR